MKEGANERRITYNLMHDVKARVWCTFSLQGPDGFRGSSEAWLACKPFLLGSSRDAQETFPLDNAQRCFYTPRTTNPVFTMNPIYLRIVCYCGRNGHQMNKQECQSRKLESRGTPHTDFQHSRATRGRATNIPSTSTTTYQAATLWVSRMTPDFMQTDICRHWVRTFTFPYVR